MTQLNRWLILCGIFTTTLLLTITSCALTKPSNQDLIKQVQDNRSLAQEMFLIDMAITHTQPLSAPVAATGLSIPVGEVELIYVGHVFANVEIDVSQMQITDVQISNNQAVIKLPPLAIRAKTDPARSELFIDTELSPGLDAATSLMLDSICAGCTTVLDLIEAGLLQMDILDDGFVEDFLLTPNLNLSMGQLETEAERRAVLQACKEGVVAQIQQQIEQSFEQVLTKLNNFTIIVNTLPPTLCP